MLENNGNNIENIYNSHHICNTNFLSPCIIVPIVKFIFNFNYIQNVNNTLGERINEFTYLYCFVTYKLKYETCNQLFNS